MAGQAVSLFGDRLVPVALAFAILDATGSVSALSVVMAAQAVPLVVFVLIGGICADRLPRQRVMLASDLVRAGCQAASAFVLLSGQMHVWELALFQGLYGTGTAFFGPAAMALVPETVARSDLQAANAFLGLADNVAAVAGPAAAGAIIATTGPGWGLGLDAVTFLVSACCLKGLPAGLSRAGRTTTLRDLKAGWRAFTSRRWLWMTVGFFTLYIGLVWGPLFVLGPDLARRALGGADAWAAIATAMGIGALFGGLAGLRWRPRYPLRMAFLGFLVSGPFFFAVLAEPGPLALIVLAAAMFGATGPIFNTLWFTALQWDVGRDELSRVGSWDYLGSLALLPAGQALCGPIAAVIGLRLALVGAGALCLVLVAAILAAPAVRNFSLAEESAVSQGRAESSSHDLEQLVDPTAG